MLRALLWAVHELKTDKGKLAVVSGIGCSNRLSACIDANSFHTTHGRPLAFTTGLALVCPNLHMIVITGDWDSLAVGAKGAIRCLYGNKFSVQRSRS